MSRETPNDLITVLFVVPSPSGGGAERCGLEVLKNLDPSVYERHLLLFHQDGEYSTEVPFALVVRESSLWDSRLVKILPRFIRKWLVPALKVGRAARRLRPDVVITFMPEASLPASLVRWLAPVPRFVWVVSEQNATRRRVYEGNPSRWRRWIQDHWIGRAYTAADQVVAVSEGVERGLLEDYGLEPAKLSVILNPVDVGRVQAEAEETVPVEWSGERLIVSMGRLTRQKGFDVLLEAFRLVRLAKSVSLVILGTGEEKRRLEDLAHELGIAADVHLVGFKSNPWSYVRRADVFVLSSRWEGCPLVIGEAMACGTPVVATACDFGPRELIKHGTNGFLTAPEDPHALADAVLEVLCEPETASRLSSNGLIRAGELDISAVSKQYDRLFQRLLGWAA